MCGLDSVGDPGSLNEGYSDLFATDEKIRRAGFTPDCWLYCKDLALTPNGNYLIRDVANPYGSQGIDWYADRWQGSNYYSVTHSNGQLITLVWKLLVTGGTHPRAKSDIVVPPLGLDTATTIFFNAWPTLTSTSTFTDLRAGTVSAAGRISAFAATATQAAWDAVGMDYIQGNGHPINLSTRAYSGTGSDVLIVGFGLAGGTGAKPILIRGVGPTLASFGVSGYMSDPIVQLFDGASNLLAQNDDWGTNPNTSAIASAASAVGAFALPANSHDAALLPNLNAGTYSVTVGGVGNTTGTVLAEFYDADMNNATHLSNLSARVRVTPSSSVTVGFVVNGSGYKKLLLRAVGPTLANFGITDFQSSPSIHLKIGSTVVRDNWVWGSQLNPSEVTSATNAVGAFALPSGSYDSAMVVDLPPGSYTAEVMGSASGIVLVEAYEVP